MGAKELMDYKNALAEISSLKEQLREANEKTAKWKNTAEIYEKVGKDLASGKTHKRRETVKHISEQSTLISELVGAMESLRNYCSYNPDYENYDRVLTKAKQFTSKEGGKG